MRWDIVLALLVSPSGAMSQYDLFECVTL